MTKLYQTLTVDEIINLAYPTVQDDPPYCHLIQEGDEYIDARTGKDCLADTESCKTCLREWLELEVIVDRRTFEGEPPSGPWPDFPWRFHGTPSDERKVLVWTRTKKGANNLLVGYYSPELGRWCIGSNTNVIAWMHLPSERALDMAYAIISGDNV